MVAKECPAGPWGVGKAAWLCSLSVHGGMDGHVFSNASIDHFHICVISFFCDEIESLLVHAEDFYQPTIDSLSLCISSAQTTHRCTFLP